MHDPFTPTPGGFGSGFGFGPQQRRALHEQRRQARREFRDQLREHGADRHGPFGPGFPPGFGFGPGRGGFPAAASVRRRPARPSRRRQAG